MNHRNKAEVTYDGLEQSLFEFCSRESLKVPLSLRYLKTPKKNIMRLYAKKLNQRRAA